MAGNIVGSIYANRATDVTDDVEVAVRIAISIIEETDRRITLNRVGWTEKEKDPT